MERERGKERVEKRPTASLQFRIEPGRVPWIYAALMNQPQVQLYNGEFPEPFTKLVYLVRHNQGQLILAAVLDVGEGFNSRYESTVGSPEDLAPLLQRYAKHEFSPDKQHLVIYRDDQVFGVIARVAENRVVIQRGGSAGQLSLPHNTPINDLAVHLDQFSLLVQRYVSAVWKASPETDQKQLQLVLSVPALPEGAPATYFSTFEIVAREFRGHPRPVDLDEGIGGYPQIKALVRSLFMDLTEPETSRRFGTQPFSNKFVLVTGAEGTGKSLVPKALDAMLRAKYEDKYEHFRLPFGDMLPRYGPHTATILETILNHLRENEKRGVPTILHLDNLEELVPPHQRIKGRNSHLLLTPSGHVLPSQITPQSDAEFAYALQTINPIIIGLRDFGRDLGGESHFIIIYGESRVPREELPESVARTFRRVFHLEPTIQDLADILRVQITTTRRFAQKSEHDPFIPDIEAEIGRIAPHAKGLTGRDIQQAILNIATRHKAAWDGKTDLPITDEEIISELDNTCFERGIKGRPGDTRRLGFQTPR